MSEQNAPPPAMDDASKIREGEELDASRLEPYLCAHIPGLEGPLEVRQFPRGHSNLTYLVRMGDREMVLRRPPFGSKVKTAHDMGREHRILEKLHAVFPRAPRPLAYCDDESVLGAKFYVMERIRGVILRKDLPAGMTLSPECARRLDEALVDTLAELHALDYDKAGLGDLGRPEGYVERQVSGWTRRYEASKTDEIPDVAWVARWLDEHRPAESGAVLLHNDFKFDNVVLGPGDPASVIGVLDWEMSTLGDPLMDLGTTLGYWLEAGDDPMLQQIRWAPTTLPGSLTRRQLADRYTERTGRSTSNIVYYYCFGLFKTAVVLQQIYFRYKQGLTKDPRFGALGLAVRVLSETAARAAQRGAL